MRAQIHGFILVLLLFVTSQCEGNIFTSRLRSRLLFKGLPKKQQKTVENKTQVVASSSLAEAAIHQARRLPWRKIAVTGAVSAAGLLTSAAVVTLRRRQRAASALTDASDIFSVDTFGRLKTLLNSTDLLSSQASDGESSSVLLVFDSVSSQGVDNKQEVVRRNNFDLIAAEVTKARSAGEKVLHKIHSTSLKSFG
jgi:hypothetical protein